ncbi:MAG: prefoldin subunit alpha [Candidatus Aenigmarchaeota archaeon]|nr:prefoldin subunit alpha [Candidatus Aenigmarchaeota archaeon]
MNEREFQEKYVQFQLLKQQMETLIQEKQDIDKKIEELQISMYALEELSKQKSGVESWSPIGSNAFVQGQINNVKEVVIGIGAGVFVKKDLNDAKKIIHSRLEQIIETNNELVMYAQKINSLISDMETELQKYAGD